MSAYLVAGIPCGDVLKHHGILGQKWGKQNGPPYPLDPEDHSQSEKKAGWRKSLDGADPEKNGKESYRQAKKRMMKEAKETYKRDSKTLGYKASVNLARDKERIKAILKKEYPDQAKNDELVKKLAIGVGVAAVVAATAYVAVDLEGTGNLYVTQSQIIDDLNSGRKRYADLIAPALDTGLDSLSDRDEVVAAGTILQRVIRDYNDTNKAIDMEKAKDFIYATFEENDNRIYQTLFNARGEGQKMITSREVLNDLIMPSPRKRAEAFANLLSDQNFLFDFAQDLGMSRTELKWYLEGGGSKGDLFNAFNRLAGDSSKVSPKRYFDMIRDMGYNAIKDDNDAGYLSDNPVILLNARKDTVVTGRRVISEHGFEMLATKLKVHVPEGGRERLRK